mmetsp:Transcript_65062/g.205584  ORF Transcript_65062/g.205584 Transcript_65062/m.205584 type:complete len:151 (-) Transcript_65062:276-728(-)
MGPEGKPAAGGGCGSTAEEEPAMGAMALCSVPVAAAWPTPAQMALPTAISSAHGRHGDGSTCGICSRTGVGLGLHDDVRRELGAADAGISGIRGVGCEGGSDSGTPGELEQGHGIRPALCGGPRDPGATDACTGGGADTSAGGREPHCGD